MLTQEERNEIAEGFRDQAGDLFEQLNEELDVYRISGQIERAISLQAIERIVQIRHQ